MVSTRPGADHVVPGKNSVFVLCGQKDKSTQSALVVSNFAIDGKT
jgi:hypothetical protein